MIIECQNRAVIEAEKREILTVSDICVISSVKRERVTVRCDLHMRDTVFL